MTERFEWRAAENLPIVFESAQEASAFVKRHLELYGWLSSNDRTYAAAATELRRIVWEPLYRLNQFVEAWMNESSMTFPQSEFETIFHKHSVPIVDTPKALLIAHLIGTSGRAAAAGALTVFVDTQLDSNGPPLSAKLLYGIVIGSNFILGLPYEKDFEKTSFDALSLEFKEGIKSLKRETKTRLTTLDNAEILRRKRAWKKALSLRRGVRKAIASEQTRLQAEIEELETVRNTYREFMQLKAPVEYWNTKASIHSTQTRKYKNALLVFSVVGGVLLVGALAFIANRIGYISETNKTSAVYLAWASLGAALSVILFWVARILVRLFMSEHHLAIDAQERATMITTYLALTNANAASEDERKIVLASIFRPTADGIVKDDGAPDFSPASMLSKALAGK